MPSKKMKIVFVVASGLLLLESRAMAQQGGVAKTCDGEIRTLCPDVRPGRGRLRECIKSRETELSGPCRATVERLAAVVNACAADRKKLCADVKPVGSRVRECLKSHMGDLGDACKAAIAKAVTGNK